MQQHQADQAFKVDIVASRDLVRGYQRRLRGIVPVPANHLAIDAIDFPTDSVDAHLAAVVAEEEQQKMAAKRKEEQHQHFRARTPPASSSSSYQLLRKPKTTNNNQPSMSLHDSLVAALSSAEDDHSSSSFAAASSSQSSWNRLRHHPLDSDVDRQEIATRRLKAAYRDHRDELKTKFHPGGDVKRAQRETIPNILERDCNSQLRHASSTRCYYFDQRICESDGSPRQVQKKKNEHQQQSDAAESSAQKKLSFVAPPSYPTIQIKRRKPVPIEERPGWTFISPTEEAAAEQLRRRQHAVTPPRATMVSVPTPYEERRMHVSPVVTQRFIQVAYDVE